VCIEARMLHANPRAVTVWGFLFGAGRGNRTLLSSLGSLGNATIRYPQKLTRRTRREYTDAPDDSEVMFELAAGNS